MSGDTGLGAAIALLIALVTTPAGGSGAACFSPSDEPSLQRGGLAGAYLGARLQPPMPEALIRRSLGLIVIAVAARYLVEGIGRL